MILSIGIDIVDIDRIEKTYNKFKNRFLQKILSKEEQNLFLNNNNDKKNIISKIATHWAIKEAISKAIGCGLLNGSPLHFNDIIILKNDRNKPFILKNEKITKLTKRLHNLNENCNLSFHISTSNDKGITIANAIIEII